MIWLLVCAGGLFAETWLIVVLGRQATGAYGAPGPGEQHSIEVVRVHGPGHRLTDQPADV
jgi:hypothetical protein